MKLLWWVGLRKLLQKEINGWFSSKTHMVQISQPYYVFLDNQENMLIENANYQDYGTVNLFKDWLREGIIINN